MQNQDTPAFQTSFLLVSLLYSYKSKWSESYDFDDYRRTLTSDSYSSELDTEEPSSDSYSSYFGISVLNSYCFLRRAAEACSILCWSLTCLVFNEEVPGPGRIGVLPRSFFMLCIQSKCLAVISHVSNFVFIRSEFFYRISLNFS